MILETPPITFDDFGIVAPVWPDAVTLSSNDTTITVDLEAYADHSAGPNSFDYAYARIVLKFRGGTVESAPATIQFEIGNVLASRQVTLNLLEGGWDVDQYDLTAAEIAAVEAEVVFGIVDEGGGFDPADELTAHADACACTVSFVGELPSEIDNTRNRTLILVTNISGGDRTVTITCQHPSRPDDYPSEQWPAQAASDIVKVIPDGGTAVFYGLPNAYNNDQGKLELSYDDTGVLVDAREIQPTL